MAANKVALKYLKENQNNLQLSHTQSKLNDSSSRVDPELTLRSNGLDKDKTAMGLTFLDNFA